MSGAVAASAPSPAVLTAKSGEQAFTFVCEAEGRKIKVFAGDQAGDAGAALIDQKLDDADECNGAKWVVNQLSESDVMLVMINPGRSGVNAQMNVYALQRGAATFAGYLPVGADDTGKGEYSFEFEQADGLWRDIYQVSDGRIGLSREIRLALDAGPLVVFSPDGGKSWTPLKWGDPLLKEMPPYWFDGQMRARGIEKKQPLHAAADRPTPTSRRTAAPLRSTHGVQPSVMHPRENRVYSFKLLSRGCRALDRKDLNSTQLAERAPDPRVSSRADDFTSQEN